MAGFWKQAHAIIAFLEPTGSSRSRTKNCDYETLSDSTSVENLVLHHCFYSSRNPFRTCIKQPFQFHPGPSCTHTLWALVNQPCIARATKISVLHNPLRQMHYPAQDLRLHRLHWRKTANSTIGSQCTDRKDPDWSERAWNQRKERNRHRLREKIHWQGPT